MSSAPTSTANPRAALLGRLVHDFLAWILFWVIGPASPWVAGLVGLGTAVILSRSDRRHGTRIQPLDVGAMAFFAVWMVAALVASGTGRDWMASHQMAVSTLAFGLVMAGTVVARHPFTEAYARQSAPQVVWGLPRFRRMNDTISLMWAAILVLHGAIAWIVQAADGPAWVNWAVLVASIALGAGIQARLVARARVQLRADLGGANPSGG